MSARISAHTPQQNVRSNRIASDRGRSFPDDEGDRLPAHRKGRIKKRARIVKKEKSIVKDIKSTIEFYNKLIEEMTSANPMNKVRKREIWRNSRGKISLCGS
jgi:hypothetical protein